MAKKNKNDTLYSISINGDMNRSLEWCDDHWYGTTNGAAFIFAKEQVEKIKAQLKKHFVKKATISDRNGVVEEWSAFAEKSRQKAKKVATKGFKIKIRL